MSIFPKKFEDMSEEELKLNTSGNDSRFVSLAQNELIKRTINKLQEIIQEFNKQSSKQTEKMIRLTWGIVGLTIIMVIGLIIQIVLSV